MPGAKSILCGILGKELDGGGNCRDESYKFCKGVAGLSRCSLVSPNSGGDREKDKQQRELAVTTSLLYFDELPKARGSGGLEAGGGWENHKTTNTWKSRQGKNRGSKAQD